MKKALCRGFVVFLVVFLIFYFPALSQVREIYLSPQGLDSNPGTVQSPLATIQEAQKRIRTLSGSDSIKVILLGGTYHLTDPVIFGKADSGDEGSPVIFTGNAGEEVNLDGGRRITGWKKFKGNIWEANVPEVKENRWNFNQLYVNGALQRRARIPNEGFLKVAGFPDGGSEVHYHTDCQRFEYAAGDIDPKWRNLEDVEVIVYHFWTDSHLPIQSIDPASRIVTFRHKAGKVFTDDFSSNGARYIVENVWEGLDQPGEWYLDRKKGKVYYIPRSGEDLSKLEVVAPVLPEFMRFEGNALKQEYVENLHFRNIGFRYTNWQLPEGNSNDQQGSASVPAAITMKGARNIVFDRCSFNNLGTFAFEIGRGCYQNQFTRNELSYLAGGGFRINGAAPGEPILERTGHNLISDNTIHHYGEVYPSAVGILLMHTDGNKVVHNHLHHGWYTGISIGWSWGYQRSLSRDNLVGWNHIHDIGQGLLSDMGAIYTLGVSPGTVIRNNLIHDVDANHYGGWGIYNDEGSTGILIENNIVYNTKFAGYNIHFARDITVRNNIFAFGRLQQLNRTRSEPHQSVYFENNIVYWKEGKLLDSNWKDKTYTYYFHPKNDQGSREVSSTFEMDYNIFYNPSKELNEVDFNGLTWKEWQAKGKDVHSVYGDPGFLNPEQYDFRLKPGALALKTGFKPIEQEAIGPRK